MSTAHTMLDWALAYANHNRPVLPCRWWPSEDAKAPLLKHGFLEATTDPDHIRGWWRKWPRALIGSPVPTDQACIDIDPRKKGTTVAKLADYCDGDVLPDTMAVYSGRMDGGVHFFFYRPVNAAGEVLRLTETKMQKKLGEGYDLKTSTGYTILPPSLHPDTRCPYEWRGSYQNPLSHPIHDMPDRLAELLIADPPPPRRIGGHMPSSNQLAGLVRRVRAETETRNKVLYWAACRLVENNYPEPAYDAIADAALAAGLPRAEVNKTINSARKALAA
jgi:hypothetical protein